MNSLKVYEQPGIAYSNRFVVAATLSSGKVVTSTNLFTTYQDTDLLLKSLHVGQPDHNGDGKPDALEVDAELFKAAAGLQVVGLSVLIGVQVNTSLVAFPAVVQLGFEGRSIALATAAGRLRLQQNVVANLSRNDYGSANPLETAHLNVSAAALSQFQQPGSAAITKPSCCRKWPGRPSRTTRRA